MKTIHAFFLFISLLCTMCLGAQHCFAAEQEVTQKQSSQHESTPAQSTPQKSNFSEKLEQTKPDAAVSGELDNKQPQEKPFLTSTDEPIPSFGWGNYFQGLGIMLLLLFVFWYILKLMRKYGNGRFLPNQKLLPRDSMYLEGQLPLGQGKSILIVKVLDERLVLGVTEKNINLLSKTGTNHAETFEELMQQVPFKNTPDA